MSLLFESIRFENGQFHNLDLHQIRVNRSYENLFPHTSPLNLEALVQDIDAVEGTYKCRISYNQHSSSIEMRPYIKKPLHSLKIVEDNMIEYNFKFEYRGDLDKLFKKRSGKDDVLIIKNNRVTDTSYGNIVFGKVGRWVTPISPLLQGIQRAFVLEKGLVTVKDILAQDIFEYDHFMVINAMLPFDIERISPIHQIFK